MYIPNNRKNCEFLSLGNKNIWKKLEIVVFIIYIWGKNVKDFENFAKLLKP